MDEEKPFVPSVAGDSKAAILPRTLSQTDRLFTPSMALSEEYTDNVFVVVHNKRGDFITRVQPGVVINYRAPFWDWDIGYNYDYRYYARHSRNEDNTHNLRGKGNLRVIDNLLLLDVSDTYRRVSLDVTRDATNESLFVDQSDQNIFSLSPYVLLNPRPNLTVRSGYRYTKESYTGSIGVDKDEQSAFVMAAHELTHKCTFSPKFVYSYVETGEDASYHRFTPSLGIRYEYADKSFLSLEGGYSWFRFGSGNSINSPYWNAALSHDFDFLTASVNAGVTYNTDPLLSSTEERKVIGRLEKPLQRGAVGLLAAYSDVRNNLAADSLQSRRFTLGGDFRYDLSEKTSCHLDLAASRFNRYDLAFNDITDLPYRLNLDASISYALAKELTVALNYRYITYRHSIGSAANSIEINRAIAEVRKIF